MTAMPDYLWIDEVGSSDNVPHQYVRADLIPHWKPIGTLDPSYDLVVLSGDGLHLGVRSPVNGKLYDQYGRLLEGHVTRWMPIPKVPE